MANTERSNGFISVVLAVLAAVLLPGQIASRFAPSTEEKKSEAGSTEEKSDSQKSEGPPASEHSAKCLLRSVAGLPPNPSECKAEVKTDSKYVLNAELKLEFHLGTPDRSAAASATASTTIDKKEDSTKVLFATVPERSWGLDGTLEALVRAFELSDYSLRGQDLPWEPNRDPKKEFGVLVFALNRGGCATCGPLYYVVYLVEESPSAGIRFQALAAALTDAKTFLGNSALSKPPLRLLAPAFSGSASTLRMFLDSNPDVQKSNVEIISGRATESGIARLLRKDSANGELPWRHFQSTVHSDEDMQAAMYTYLQEKLKADCSKIALIVESSTPYGAATIKAPDNSTSLTASNSTTKSESGSECKSEQQSAPKKCQPRLLPVPYDLRSIGAEWDRKRKSAPTTGSPATAQELANTLELQRDEGRRTSLIPTYSHNTSSRRQLTLSTLLGTLHQEGVRYLGLMMTDPGDKLFLAEQISLECPDVRLFTFETEIELFHPKHLMHTRGMLVASTYPLFSRNQQWTYPFRGAEQRLQFASQADQGMYNATLLLIGRPDLLLEYAPPFESFKMPDDSSMHTRCSGFTSAAQAMPSWRHAETSICFASPPVWISAVGLNGLIPLHAVVPDAPQEPAHWKAEHAGVHSSFMAERRDAVTGTELPVTQCGVPAPKRQLPTAEARYTAYDLGAVRILTAVLTALALLLAIPYFRNTFGRPLWVSKTGDESRLFDILRGWQVSRSGLVARKLRYRDLYLLWISLPLLVLEWYLGLLSGLRFRSGNSATNQDYLARFWGISKGITLPDWSKVLDLLNSLLAAMGASLMLLLTLCALLSIFRYPLHAPRILVRLMRPPWAVALVGGLTVLLFASQIRVLDTLRAECSNDLFLILFLRRSAQTAYELSPVIPLLCLGTISALWGFYNLRRLLLLWRRPLRETDRIITAPDALASSVQEALASCYRALDYTPTTTVVAVGILTAVIAGPVFGRLSTIDHYLVHWLFRLLFGMSMVLILLAMMRLLTSWFPLQTALRHLAHHPLYEALERIPRRWIRPLGTMIVEELPTATEEQMLRQRMDALVSTMAATTPAARRELVEPVLYPQLQVVEEAVSAWDSRSPSCSATTVLQPELIAALGELLYGCHSVPRPLSSRDLSGKESPATASVAWLTSAEDLLAVRMQCQVSELMPHLRNSMLLVTVSMILMLAALTSYPFQPMQWMTMLVWLLFLSMTGLQAMVLLQMNRNAVLSGLAGGTAGQIDWNFSFIRTLAMYVLLPLGSLASTQFSKFSWLVNLLQNVK